LFPDTLSESCGQTKSDTLACPVWIPGILATIRQALSLDSASTQDSQERLSYGRYVLGQFLCKVN